MAPKPQQQMATQENREIPDLTDFLKTIAAPPSQREQAQALIQRNRDALNDRIRAGVPLVTLAEKITAKTGIRVTAVDLAVALKGRKYPERKKKPA